MLNEIAKRFLTPPDKNKESSTVIDKNVIVDLTNNDQYPMTGAFFDSESNSLFNTTNSSDILFKQKEKILKYRQLAMQPDVADCIDEIVNEIIFNYDDKMPIKINIEIENEKLVKAINEKHNKIMKMLNVKRNLYQIVKNSYIDGQLVMHTGYDNNNVKKGIQSIKMIEPIMLYFDTKNNTFRYLNDDRNTFLEQDNSQSYSIEEIVIENFGLQAGKINLGYLEYAIKSANVLSTLEDLLIPMRFSRSISRRVFNVDIGDLPVKRGAEVMVEHQNKFKYKKFYNNQTGEVSNQQHITSMVEDYWFANRSGGKGTTVDVLDESGNLGELGDIIYFSKKLYKSLKIPSSRVSVDHEADHNFDFESTQTSKDDMKFFMFISRLRQVYSSMFKELLKREIISCDIVSETEWNDIENDISITFVNENKFIEKMKLDNFMKRVEIYTNTKEYIGKLYSASGLVKEVFGKSDEEIIDALKDISVEEKKPLFKKFYTNQDGDEDEQKSW